MTENVVWDGHQFQVAEPGDDWNDVPGVYIFAGLQPQGWKAYYIGEAAALRDRPIDGHEKWGQAAALGATHVHAMLVNGGLAKRQQIEARLIEVCQPPLNIQHK